MSDLVQLGELVDPDSLTTPMGDFDADLLSVAEVEAFKRGEAVQGQRVVVTAVLERTSVYHPTGDNSDRKTALHERFLVDPDAVRMVERRDPRADAAARGRANAHQVPRNRRQTKGAAAQAFNQASATTHGGHDMAESHRQRMDELREEAVSLRTQLEREARAAELGRDLARLTADPDTPAEEWARLRERAAALTREQGAA